MTKQIRLHAEQIAIAAAVVEDGFDRQGALDEEREGAGRHARRCARAVRDIDGIDAEAGQFAHPRQHALDGNAARGEDLDGDDEFTADARGQSRFFGARNGLDRVLRLGVQDHRARLPARLQGADSPCDGADVLRGCPATAANYAGAGGDETARVFGVILRCRHVEEAALKETGQAGVGLGRNEGRPGPGQAPDHFEHGVRADGTVGADDIRPLREKSLHNGLGLDPKSGFALLVIGHLGDDWQLADLADGAQRESDLVEVLEGFEKKEVDPGLGERGGLLAEKIEQFSLGDRAELGHLDAGRPDRPRHIELLPRSLAGELDSAAVDGFRLLLQAVRLELEAVGAVGVGLEDIGVRGRIGAVEIEHQFGRREVELIIAAVDEDAAAVEHGAHGAVTDEDALPDAVEKSFRRQRGSS